MSLRLIFTAEDYPVLQNRTYENVEEARNCRTGQIRLVQDMSTGLIFNEAFDADLINYDINYHNEQTYSKYFRTHMAQIADLVSEAMSGTHLVEVGCGKGDFLELLQSRGSSITGFDPAYDGNNKDIERRYFTDQFEKKNNGLILRHVLEHVSDPVDFLKRLRDANGGTGLVYIEVPCFDWILKNRAFFDVFYEHVNYFRLADFFAIFGEVIYAKHSFGGQYLSIIADLSTIRKPKSMSSLIVDLQPGFFPSKLEGNHNEIVWGAASKGVVYSMLRERSGCPVSRVIDVNPSKQGRYLPVTGLKVQSPADGLLELPRDCNILVMNPNYFSEIQKIVGDEIECKAI